MLHPDDDIIAAAAIGESLTGDEARHVAECARCAAHLSDIEQLARRAGSMGLPAALFVPPAHVWEAIVAELSVDQAGQDEAGQHKTESELLPTREVERPVERPAGHLATVTPIRRFSSGWRIASAAAVGLVIGGVGVNVVTNLGGGNATVVASAPLTNLATEAPAGTARVEDRADGVRVLVVNTDYLETPEGDLEVWLIDPNVEGMVSVGFLASSQGEFVIPAGYDPSDYPIVDISIEPRDGVPTHSGVSITRGVLEL